MVEGCEGCGRSGVTRLEFTGNAGPNAATDDEEVWVIHEWSGE